MTALDNKAALQSLSQALEHHRTEILQRWENNVRAGIHVDDELEFEHLKEAIATIIDNFIHCMAAADVTAYQEANAAVAAQLAYNDVSYQAVFDAFQYYEEVYWDFAAEQLDVNEILHRVRVLGRLHHETISSIMDQYFQINDNTAFAIAKLVEMRDYETGGHLERTRDISVMIAEAMEVDRSFCEQLYRVGPLHDLGKIGVSDTILLKPSRLTDAEYELMKRHTTIGADAISSVIGTQQINRGYLLMAIEVALYHHERFDGRGYPDGLRGKQIPLSARIFSVADTYDAITSDRPYQAARSHEQAVAIIAEEQGRQFDPDITAVFLQITARIEAKLAEYQRLTGQETDA